MQTVIGHPRTMSKRNKFSRSKNNWPLNKWKTVCPEFHFRKISKSNVPDFISPSLMSTFNSGYFATSGTTQLYENKPTPMFVGFVVGLRIDGNELDEQPYVAVYDKSNEELLFSGYLQHADYSGRTTALTKTQLDILTNSGITADIKTLRLPSSDFGTLEDLAKENIIEGIEFSAIKAVKKIDKDGL